MKPFKVIVGAFLVTTLFAFTLEGDKASQKVKDAFAKKFPAANKVKWEKENATEWEAEFEINKVEYSANFLEDGTWTETEHEIEEKDVPQNVKSTLKSEFPDYEMEEAEISETQNGIVYEFEIEKGETEIKVVIALDGTIIKKQDNDEREGELEEND